MKKIYQISMFSILMMMSTTTHANSVYFQQYASIGSGTVTVTVYYDFTDFAMFGGGFDLHYDPQEMTFVSYTQANFAGNDAQEAASPIGFLDSPGLYSGAGIGTFDFFSGITSAGEIGTFVFTFDSNGDPYYMPSNVELLPNAINPFISLSGEDVSYELLGITPVPVPAALWLFVSAIIGLGWNARRVKNWH